MSRKFSPNFEGSLNLEFGVFSFTPFIMNNLALQKGERNQHRFLVLFYDEIIGSKNHSENSLSFSLLKSESVNMSFGRKD